MLYLFAVKRFDIQFIKNTFITFLTFNNSSYELYLLVISIFDHFFKGEKKPNRQWNTLYVVKLVV